MSNLCTSPQWSIYLAIPRPFIGKMACNFREFKMQRHRDYIRTITKNKYEWLHVIFDCGHVTVCYIQVHCCSQQGFGSSLVILYSLSLTDVDLAYITVSVTSIKLLFSNRTHKNLFPHMHVQDSHIRLLWLTACS